MFFALKGAVLEYKIVLLHTDMRVYAGNAGMIQRVLYKNDYEEKCVFHYLGLCGNALHQYGVH